MKGGKKKKGVECPTVRGEGRGGSELVRVKRIRILSTVGTVSTVAREKEREREGENGRCSAPTHEPFCWHYIHLLDDDQVVDLEQHRVAQLVGAEQQRRTLCERR